MTRARLLKAGSAAALVVALALPAGLAVAQVVRSSVDVSAGAGYSTNPFLVIGEDTDSALVEGTVRPRVTIEEERSVTSFDAFLTHQQYFERFGSATNYGASANHNTRVNERLAVNAGVGFDSGILGGAQFAPPVFAPPVTPVVPGTTTPGVTTPVAPTPGVLPGGTLPGATTPGTGVFPGVPGTGPVIIDPTLPDIGLLGTQARRTSFSGNLGATYTPGPRDTWGASVFAQRNTYDTEFLGGNFSSFSGNLSYTRLVSQNLSVGGQLVTTFSHFDDAPNARVIQPQLTVNATLSPQWTLNGGVGVSFTRFDGGFGLPPSNDTALAVNATLCRRNVRSTFCVSGARTAAPSGLGGVQNINTVGASYSYQLGERDGITASASYTSTDGSQFDIDSQEFVSASVGWSRQLSERLRLNATAGYRNIFFGDFDRKADFSGLIGVGYLLGDRR